MNEGPTISASAEKANLKERFESVLAGRFDRMPNGRYQTNLPGIDSMTIVRQNEKTLSVVLIHDGGKRRTTFSLYGDGILGGEVRDFKKLGLANDQVLAEVLRVADSIYVGAWHHVPDDMLPPGFWPQEKTGKGREGRPRTPGGVDAERIKFMTSQRDFLFCIDARNSGLRGYYGYVFPWGIVLENEQIGNAAYFVDFDEPLETHTTEAARAPLRGTRLSRADAAAKDTEQGNIVSKYWKPIANSSKFDVRQKGHQYLIHTKGSWQDSMSEQFEKRRPN